MNEYYDKPKLLPTLTNLLYENLTLLKTKTTNQNILVELFVIGIELKENKNLDKLLDQIESMMDIEILNFDKNLILTKKLMEKFFEGGVEYLGISNQRLMDLLERLKVQLDLYGQHDCF